MANFLRMTDIDLAGKRVLIREDLNVPIKDGKVTSDARLRASLPTIQAAVRARGKVMLLSHLGRPEEGVRSMPPPLSIVEGSKYDFSVIAAIGAMKFAFHLPTYRQQDWFAQYGWFPRRSTVNDLFNYSVDTVVPLVG